MEVEGVVYLSLSLQTESRDVTAGEGKASCVYISLLFELFSRHQNTTSSSTTPSLLLFFLYYYCFTKIL